MSPPAAARRGFALTGPTVALDPRTNAVRGDLADVRLAEYVFAPHYASPVACRLAVDAPLRLARAAGSEPIAQLSRGSAFEVLEIAGSSAWGIATGPRLVGYLDADALDAR